MTKKIKQPDPTQHLILSLIKSGLRIFAGTLLILGTTGIMFTAEAIMLSGISFVVAEIVGIFEELV